MTTLSDIINLKPLHIGGVADFHCHCDYSVDAEGTVDEFCEAALQRNLAEICFTTHFDANPNSEGDIEYIRVSGENKPVTLENLAPYVDDVHRAAEKYYPSGLSVKLGVEIGWFDGCEELTQRLIERYDFDHVLCGIHEVDNICFCCHSSEEKFFSRFSAEQVAEKYFEQVCRAAQTRLFDCIAHLAYYTRAGLTYHGEVIKRVHEPYIRQVFSELVNTGTGLEVNTSGIRHGLKDYYPSIAIINAATKAGVAVTCLGSDAHRPEQLGFDFEAAAALVPNNVQGCED